MKYSGTQTELGLEVVPNSRETRIGFNPWTGSLRVKTRAKALKGMANKEVLSELEKLFKAKAEIVAGEKSRKKKVLLNVPQNQVKKILESVKEP